MAKIQASIVRTGQPTRIVPWNAPEFYERSSEYTNTKALFTGFTQDQNENIPVDRIQFSNFMCKQGKGDVTSVGTYLLTYLTNKSEFRALFTNCYDSIELPTGEQTLECNDFEDTSITPYGFGTTINLLPNKEIKYIYYTTTNKRILIVKLPFNHTKEYNNNNNVQQYITLFMIKENDTQSYDINILDWATYYITLYDGSIRKVFGTCPISRLYETQWAVVAGNIQTRAKNQYDSNEWCFAYDKNGAPQMLDYNPATYNMTEKFEDNIVDYREGQIIPTCINFKFGKQYNYEYTLIANKCDFGYTTFSGNSSPSSLNGTIRYLWTHKYTSDNSYNTWQIVGMDISEGGFTGQSNDPNAPTPNPDGGNGSYEGGRDIVGIDDKPINVGLYTGSRNLYRLTGVQATEFISYLMSGSIQETWSKFQQDPEQYIISFMTTWCPTDDGDETPIHIAGVTTNVNAFPITESIIELEYGPFTATHYFDNFLDYAPYTTYELYIPYVGFKKLLPEDVFIEGGLRLSYRIDIITGAGKVYIIGNDTVLYSYSVRVNTPEPLSALDFSQKYFNAFKAAIGIGGAIGGVITGNLPAVIGGVGVAASSAISAFKPAEVDRISEQDFTANLLENREPYLLITRPSRYLPENFGHIFGYKANMVRNIGDLKGYTKVKQINLHIPEATADEVSEIVSIMKGGFYVY